MTNPNFPPEQQVILWDVLQIDPQQLVRLRVLSVNASVRQAIRLGVDSGKGHIVRPGERLRDIALLAEPDAEWDIEVASPNGVLSVYQKWEFYRLDGAHGWKSQGDYAGMLVTRNGPRSEYHCNNGLVHDTFDKLVFSVELLP
jgi:hypothetical protein